MINKNLKIIIGFIVLLPVIAATFLLWNKYGRKDVYENNFENDEIFNDLKKIYPEVNYEQFLLYSDIALKKTQETCHSQENEGSCWSAVGLLTNNKVVCGEVEDEKKIECANAIFLKTFNQEIEKCYSEGDLGLKLLCFQQIFAMYKKDEDCSGLSDKEKQLCKDVLNYQSAISQLKYDFCPSIKDEFLQTYCIKYTEKYKDKSVGSTYEEVATQPITETLDSDSDGLTNFEELSIYKTDLNIADTDGDGFSDGDEVNGGYNPNGEGRLSN